MNGQLLEWSLYMHRQLQFTCSQIILNNLFFEKLFSIAMCKVSTSRICDDDKKKPTKRRGWYEMMSMRCGEIETLCFHNLLHTTFCEREWKTFCYLNLTNFIRVIYNDWKIEIRLIDKFEFSVYGMFHTLLMRKLCWILVDYALGKYKSFDRKIISFRLTIWLRDNCSFDWIRRCELKGLGNINRRTSFRLASNSSQWFCLFSESCRKMKSSFVTQLS